MNINPDIAFRPAGEIKAWQEAQLRQLLGYLRQHSPFYREHFERHRLDAGSILSLEDLARIPPTTKEDLQLHNWDFLCVPRRQVAEYTATSGTLGQPVTIALTPADLDRLAYNEAQSFACAGCRPGDLFQLMLTLDRQFMAGIAYYSGIRRLGGSVVRIGPGLPMLQWDSIRRLRPQVLVAVPSFLLHLLEYAAAQGIDPRESGVGRIICIGEGLRDEHLAWNALAERIRSQWPVQLFSTYAATEMQTAFPECEAGQGGHLHPDLLIAEILDADKQPVGPGEIGEITITTLGVEGMPLLRYQTGDMARFHSEPCSCGRHSPRLGPILGRKNQMIKLRGTSLYPQSIADLLQRVGIGDYVIEADRDALGLDRLRIHLLAENQEGEQALRQHFQSGLRIQPELCFAGKTELEALQALASTRKASRFLDRRRAL